MEYCERRNTPIVAICLGLSLLTAGCASVPVGENDESVKMVEVTPAAHDLVAQDFVSVITQLPAYKPWRSTLSLKSVGGDDQLFGESLSNVLIEKGYNLRVGEAVADDIFLAFDVNRKVDESSIDAVEYQLNIDDIGLRRHYKMNALGQITPLSAMQARGIDPAMLFNNDSVFDNQDQLTSSANISEENARSIDAGSLQAQKLRINSPWPLDSEHNFRDLGKSRYKMVLTDYLTINEEIVKFPDNSSALSVSERQNIKGIVKIFSGSTDVITIVGCSHGGGGNGLKQKKLAQARATLARLVLIEMGVPANRILVEASWSTKRYDDVLPRRAAVIALRRQ